MYDYFNEDGLLVHSCGLHVFHTNSPDVTVYVRRFSEWNEYRTKVAASIDGKLVPFPFNRDSLNLMFGLSLQSDEDVAKFLASERVPIASPRNAEEMALSLVGPRLWETFFEGYTRKWWGRDPRDIDARVTARIAIRGDSQVDYQNDHFQGVPRDGYTAMFTRMVAHPKITLALQTDYRDVIGSVRFGRLIFTGAIDDFFDHVHGRLPYRAMRFEYETIDTEYLLPVHQVVYPKADHPYMRVFEFKHATRQKHPKTTVIREYPMDAGPGTARDYPIPIAEADEMYRKYKEDADKLSSVIFLGRLAQYRYYTMGQTVARALTTFQTRIATPSGKSADRSLPRMPSTAPRSEARSLS